MCRDAWRASSVSAIRSSSRISLSEIRSRPPRAEMPPPLAVAVLLSPWVARAMLSSPLAVAVLLSPMPAAAPAMPAKMREARRNQSADSTQDVPRR